MRYNEIYDALNERKKVLCSYRSLDNAKYSVGKKERNPERMDFDDSDWNSTELPCRWDNRKDAWFRIKIKVPKKIGEAEVRGSNMKVRGESDWPNPVLNMRGEMYIDDKLVLEAPNWFDLSFYKIVAENVEPGEEHIIAIHANGNVRAICTYSAMPKMEVRYSKVDDLTLEIEAFIEEMRFAKSLPGGVKVLEKIFKNISGEYIKNLKLNELIELVHKFEEKMLSLKKIAKDYEVHLAGHAHIDMNWLWPMDETINAIRDTAVSVNNVMKEYKDLCYTQSQAYTYKAMENNYPEAFKIINKRINEGIWEPAAASWVEMDLNMSNGEAIAHQILYGKRYLKEKFNYNTRIFLSPDTFGHPWTMPQILKRSGIDYYYFTRASKKDKDIFWWKGLDGSKVLAFNSAYLNNISPEIIIDVADFYYKTTGLKKSMYVYGIGDHGGGPTREDARLVKKLNEKPIFPKIVFTKMQKYLDFVKKKGINFEVNDELQFIADGCYTTHWDIKIHNRLCEKLLLKSQKVGSIAKLLGKKYPNLHNYWEAALFNQFHDILPGSGIKDTYDYACEEAKKVEIGCKNIIKDNLEFLGTLVDSSSIKGKPILVFNSLSWRRTDIVEIEIYNNCPENPVAKDSEGNVYPTQIIDNKIIFVANDIPSFGYKVYYIQEGEKNNNQILKDDYIFENEYFKMEVSKKGTVNYLYDKKEGKTIIDYLWDEGIFPKNAFPLKEKAKNYPDVPITKVVRNNLLQVLYEEPHDSSAWVIGPIRKIVNLTENPEIEILERGPVIGKLRVKNKVNNSIITQDIIMYMGINRIDFRTNINWNEKADDKSLSPMVKASFTPKLGKTKATYEIPYGNIERNADGREIPALQWADISDDGYGFSILSDTKYGFDTKGNTIRITLIRTAYEPDPEPDKGYHSFVYSIYPHKGNWKEGDTDRKGYELNNKLDSCFLGRTKSKGLPSQKSFIDVDGENSVIISCLKKAEDNEDLILRLYESKGKYSNIVIIFGFNIKSIKEVNMLEEKISNSIKKINKKRIRLKIKPYEIRTFRIKI